MRRKDKARANSSTREWRRLARSMYSSKSDGVPSGEQSMSSITIPEESSFRCCPPLITTESERSRRIAKEVERRRSAVPASRNFGEARLTRSTATIACRHTAPSVASTLMRRDAVRCAHRATSAGTPGRYRTMHSRRHRATFGQDNVWPSRV